MFEGLELTLCALRRPQVKETLMKEVWELLARVTAEPHMYNPEVRVSARLMRSGDIAARPRRRSVARRAFHENATTDNRLAPAR